MITKDKIIMLENKGEFICVNNIVKDNYNYLYLVSNFKPLEVVIAKQLTDEKNNIVIVNNKQERENILELLK